MCSTFISQRTTLFYSQRGLQTPSNFLFEGIPSPPIITPMRQEISSNNITLSWSPQTANGCPLTMYSIHYRLIYPGGAWESWNQVNVTNVTKTSHTVSLEYDRQYTIEMSTWNELGQSARSRPWIITTASSGT